MAFKIFFIQSSSRLQTLPWEVSYVLQRLCRTLDTVFRREIDSLRQWGYQRAMAIVSPLRRSVSDTMTL